MHLLLPQQPHQSMGSQKGSLLCSTGFASPELHRRTPRKAQSDTSCTPVSLQAKACLQGAKHAHGAELRLPRSAAGPCSVWPTLQRDCSAAQVGLQ